jgi:signal transduction histidine kinase
MSTDGRSVERGDSVAAASGTMQVVGQLSAAWLDELLTISLDPGPPLQIFVNLLDLITRALPGTHVGGVVHDLDDSTFHTLVRSPLAATTQGATAPGSPFDAPGISVLADAESYAATFYVCHNDSVARQADVVALLTRASDVFRCSCARFHQLRRTLLKVERLQGLEAASAENTKLASLGQFAAGVVHDLSSPLTSIVGYADYLIHKGSVGSVAADPEDFDRLRRISESANRMLRFARSVVSYVRPSTEARPFCSVHALLDDALAFCDEELRNTGARIVRDYAPGQILMRGAPEPLTQAFVNLINNACHAMAPGTAVLRIATRTEPAQRVVLTFEDNGSGILPEHQSRIFSPFFTTKAAGKGTGLGLAIVKRIVEEHAGSVSVERTEPQGTRFVITLPIDVASSG